MPSTDELDLTGLLPPTGLLQCKQQLNKMPSGEIVCVCLKDQAVAKDLALIIERSKDRIVKQQKNDGVYRIYIEKG
jgi:TusA-related sulfurtransferase